MQSEPAGRIEILTNYATTGFPSGLEVHGRTRENVAAERIVPLRVGIAVDRATAGRGVTDDEWRLAVEHIVGSKSKLELLFDSKYGCHVEIVLCSQPGVRRTDGIIQVELRIERGE